MDWRALLIASAAFALYVLCPRMTAMILQESKVKGVDVHTIIIVGTIISIPLFIMLVHVILRLGIEWAIFIAAAADVAAAALLGTLDLRAGVELLIITAFVYAGIKLAPLISGLLLKWLGRTGT